VNAVEFASQFCLKTQIVSNKHEGRFVPNAKSKVAAVLVPIVERPKGLTVLLTQRAQNLRHHPGQISFPGGRQDKGETIIETAFREAQEEVDLDPTCVTPLGWLPMHQTITNYTVYPLVGLIKNINPLTANPDEVDHFFEVPIEFFLHRKQHFTISPKINNKRHSVHFMPYQNKMIWGATAAILDKLALHFE